MADMPMTQDVQNFDWLQLLFGLAGAGMQQFQHDEGYTEAVRILEDMKSRTAGAYGDMMGSLGDFGNYVGGYMTDTYGTGLDTMLSLWDASRGGYWDAVKSVMSGTPFTPGAGPAAVNPLALINAFDPFQRNSSKYPTPPGAGGAPASTYDPNGAFPWEYLSPSEQGEIRAQMGEERLGLFGLGPRGEYSGKSQSDVDRILWQKFGDRVPTRGSGRASKGQPGGEAGKVYDVMEIFNQPVRSNHEWEDRARILSMKADEGYELDWRGFQHEMNKAGDKGKKITKNLMDAGVKIPGLEDVDPAAFEASADEPIINTDELDPWLQGWEGLFNEATAEYEKNVSDTRGRWDKILGHLDEYGEVAHENTNEAYDDLAGNLHQDLIDRGLTGSSVLATTRTGVESKRATAHDEIDESLAQDRMRWEGLYDEAVGEAEKGLTAFKTNLAAGFTDQLANYLFGGVALDDSWGQNLLNDFRQQSNAVVPVATGFADTGINLWQTMTGQLNAIDQAMIPSYPSAPNVFTDVLMPWSNQTMSRAQERQAYDAMQPGFWDQWGGPITMMGSAALTGGMGALFAPAAGAATAGNAAATAIQQPNITAAITGMSRFF